MCKSSPLVVLGLTTCVFVSCGGDRGPALYKTTGTLTMDGVPLEGATVTFVPQGKGQLAGAAKTDASGKFEILATSGKPGITAGEYKVTVRKVEGEGFDGGPGATKEQQEQAMMDQMTGKGKPLKYVVPIMYSDVTRTTLIASVTDDPAKNVFPLEVKSGG